MGIGMVKILDECLERTSRGESVEDCLAGHEDVQKQLEPLLDTALFISCVPKVVPSRTFRKRAVSRLMTRLQPETGQAKVVELEQNNSPLDDVAMALHKLWHSIIGVRRVAVPVTLGLVLIIATVLGASNFISPTATLASGCTLTILNGTVDIQAPEADAIQQGTDGMALEIGTRIKTAGDSHALLTFFDGSTLKLEPSTDIEIQELAYNDEKAITVVLKQWAGKTWNRVVKMADAGSRYEIETPSACAIVRGTLFATEVNEDGSTTVTTTEGLVSVVGQEEEVYLPPNRQTRVYINSTPSQPVESPKPPATIIINVDESAVGSIIDPTGASTGNLQDGSGFNQIPGSQSLLYLDGNQVITVPEPTSGEYTVALRFVTDGKAHFKIQGISNGESIFDFKGKYEGTCEDGWLIRFNLQVEDGVIVGSQIIGVEPLNDETPEKIVKSKFTAETKRIPAISAQGNNDNNGQAVGLGLNDKPVPPVDVPAGPPAVKPVPPVDVPAGPPSVKPVPPVDVPAGPPSVKPVPPVTPPIPPIYPKRPMNQPGPPAAIPVPPVDVPAGPPAVVPGPPVVKPEPPVDVPGPPVDVPEPPIDVPGPPDDDDDPPGKPDDDTIGKPDDTPGKPAEPLGQPPDVPKPDKDK